MGSALDRLAAETGVSPVGPGALDQLAAAHQATLQRVGLSQVASPAEAAAAPPVPSPASGPVPPVAADVTAAHPGPEAGEPPAWLRVPAEILAAPIKSAIVASEYQDQGAREAAAALDRGQRTITPLPGHVSNTEGALAIAQTLANVAAPGAEAALADRLGTAAADRVGTDAAESIAGRALTHAAAAAPVGAAVNLTYDPTHPVRAILTGGALAALAGGAGGAAAAHGELTTQAAQQADADVAQAYARGTMRGPGGYREQAEAARGQFRPLQQLAATERVTRVAAEPPSPTSQALRAHQDALAQAGARREAQRAEAVAAEQAAAARREAIATEPPSAISQAVRRFDEQRYGAAAARPTTPAEAARIQRAAVAHGSPEQANATAQRIAEEGGPYVRASVDGRPTSAERLRNVRAATSKRAWIDVRGQPVGSLDGIRRVMTVFRDPTAERLHVILTDDQGRVLSHTLETSGAVDYLDAINQGWAKKILKRARRVGATRMILGHNHPSGVATPSPEDVAATTGLAPWFGQRGLRLEGQYIIDHTTGTWITADGRQVPHAVPAAAVRGLPTDWTDAHGPRIRTADDVAGLVRGAEEPSALTVGYLDKHRHLLAIEPHRPTALQTMPEWLTARMRAHGARRVVLITNDAAAPGSYEQALTTVSAMRQQLRAAEQAADPGAVAPLEGARYVDHVLNAGGEGPPTEAMELGPVPANPRRSFGGAVRLFERDAGAGSAPDAPAGAVPADRAGRLHGLGRGADAARDAGADALGARAGLAAPGGVARTAARRFGADRLRAAESGIAPAGAARAGGGPPRGGVAAPEVDAAAADVRRHGDAVRQLLAPASRGRQAGQAAHIIRAQAASLARDLEQASESLKGLSRAFARTPEPERLAFIDRMEHGAAQPTPELTAAATQLRTALDQARDEVRALGTGKLEHFIQDYFPHIWQDPEQAKSVLGRLLGKRPLEGPKSFLKQRTIPTTAEGIAAGLRPVTTNPVDLTMLKLREMRRYVFGQRVLAEMEQQGLVRTIRPSERVPAGFVPLNDRVATRYAYRAGGYVITGRMIAPEPVARVFNNYLSAGLSGNALYDAYRAVGNTLNQAQLGFSAFHLGFTSLDAAVSKASLAVMQLGSGHPLEALRSAAEVPLAPLTNYLRGSKVLREYLAPGTQGGEMARIVDGLVAAGGRVRMDSFYHNSAVERFLAALHERRPLKAAGLSLPAALEAAARPIFEVIVPRQKLGVFADLARFELERLPETATTDDVRAVMARAWDSVDNRMGQLVYDNTFWHRALKDLAFASVRSVGWNFGTLRELGGGAVDVARMATSAATGRPVQLTPRAAYLVALPMTVGLVGGMMTYLATGEPPKELKDYFFPRTGRTDADGNAERLTLPSYMKDLFAYATHPVETVTHKLHPLLGAVAEMLQNEDYYGNQIRNPDDPAVAQLAQEARYLTDQFVPFGIQNVEETVRRGESLAAGLPSFVGVTPAPRGEVRTPAQNRVMQLLATRRSVGATPEQVAQRRQRTAIRQDLRQGSPDAVDELRDAIASGVVTPRGARQLRRSAKTPPWVARFQQLTVDEALDVYAKATPDERRTWRHALFEKVKRARHDGRRDLHMPPL